MASRSVLLSKRSSGSRSTSLSAWRRRSSSSPLSARWRGERVAQRLLPFMLATAAVFYWATRRTNGDFLVFVIYSSGTTIFSLTVHAFLARRGLPGAKGVAIGLGVSLAAGLFQASSLSLSLIWQFDHNGLFHLAQLVGLVILIPSLRLLLLTAGQTPPLQSTR